MGKLRGTVSHWAVPILAAHKARPSVGFPWVWSPLNTKKVMAPRPLDRANGNCCQSICSLQHQHEGWWGEGGVFAAGSARGQVLWWSGLLLPHLHG
jgi:hypothetical protein